jgi:uncharacterized BrkB/YihY/UPF0761 family membrane protein
MGIYKRVSAGLCPQVQATFKQWRENDGHSLSAGVAYYAVCSFFPLVLLLIFALGLVLQFSAGAQNAQQRLLGMMESQMSAVLAGHINNALNGIRTGTVLGGPLGIGALLLVGLGVFVQVDRAFDRIFDTGAKTVQGIAATIRNVLVRRLRAFLVLISVTILTMLGLVASLASSLVYNYVNTLPGVGFVWRASHVVAMIALNWLLFSLLYMALPKVPSGREADKSWLQLSWPKSTPLTALSVPCSRSCFGAMSLRRSCCLLPLTSAC